METILDLDSEQKAAPVVNEGDDSEGCGTLCVLDASGDSQLQWSRSKPEQVAAARTRFKELRGKCFLAYKVVGLGGEVIDTFDPQAERIVMHAPMIGG